jgi:ubiquinone/menaquinone biosynthesis C-methylase UbiE
VYLESSDVNDTAFVPAKRGQSEADSKGRANPILDTEAVRKKHSKDAIAAAKTRARYGRGTLIYDIFDGLSELLSPKSRRQRLQESRRQKLWSLVPAGRILEVGVGTGRNIPYYPAGAEVTAIDLSDKVLARAHGRATPKGVKIALYEMDVQYLGFSENSFDTVVASWVFCSVRDPVLALQELGRVVRPEGRIVLLDHVRIDRPVIGRLMDLLNPVAVRSTGANINRRTAENARRAGLIIEREKDLARMGAVKLIVARPSPEPIRKCNSIAEIQECRLCSPN